MPLLIVVQTVPLDIAALVARRFSALGLASVATLTATALFQGWVLSGGVPGLTGTAYGGVLLTKAALFAMLIVLAIFNRFRLAPALAGPRGQQNRRTLVRNVAVEVMIGLGVVLAAAVLSSLEPGMHRV